MSTNTTEPPVSTILQRLAEAEAAVQAADADAARQAALAAAAKPATRRQLKAAADTARTELEARRAVALEAYALQTNELLIATEAVADAHTALAVAYETAFKARRHLAKLRREIEDTCGMALAKERYDAVTNEANRAAVRDAQAAVESAMRDLPPVPAPFAHRFSSRMPGVAAALKAEAVSIRLPV